MKYKLFLLSLLILFSISFSSLNITFYHAIGCPHCANTELLFEELSTEYELEIIKKEVSQNQDNLNELFETYSDFNFSSQDGGVPTVVVNNDALIVGEMTKDKWLDLFDDCLDEDGCTKGIYTQTSFTPIGGKPEEQQLTLAVLIGAAIVDSINPCTIAVMVMLLGVILLTKGREKTLFAGLAFASTIFVMYLLMGFGFLHAINSSGLTSLFFSVVTAIALILSILEFNAYFNYKPGFLSVEMPMFLRPHTKTVMKKATSLPGIVTAAIFCSLFLLPCSSGPYLLVLGMIAKSVTFQSLSYLILYNFVFVLPMLIITFAIYKGITTVEDMAEIKNKYIREIHLVSGIILFFIFLLMLNQIFPFI